MSGQKKKPSFLTTFTLGGISACTAECVVYPLDMIKTRLQIAENITRASPVLSGSANLNATATIPSRRPGMISVGTSIIKSEGVIGLYMGFSAACYRHIIYSGVRYVAYEILREKIFQRNIDGSFPLWKSSVAALLAGAIGQFVASPTDLVKVQMQTEGFRVLNGQAKLYTGTFNCFQTLYKNYGFFGMWKGWLPNVQRAALVQLGDLTAYDLSKQYILYYTTLKDNIGTHSLASIVAGLVSTTMSTPSDVLKTRIMTNPTKYKSTTDCLLQTVNNEGFFALYKGFFPIWMRMGPKALVFYVTFEQLRKIIGLSSW